MNMFFDNSIPHMRDPPMEKEIACHKSDSSIRSKENANWDCIAISAALAADNWDAFSISHALHVMPPCFCPNTLAP